MMRREARRLGLKRYFTGRPCRNGHVALRFIDGHCVVCAKETQARSMAKPEVRARALETSRAYHKKNRKKRLVQQRIRYARNPEATTARMAVYHKNNPEARRRFKHNRRALERNAKGTFTKADIEKLMRKQKGICAGCPTRLSKKSHLDHKTPLSRGGSNWPRNLQLLCAPCNQSKSDKTNKEWRATK